MHVFSRMAVAIAATWICATVPAAQAGDDDCNGKILFTRSVSTQLEGTTSFFYSSASLYTVDQDGTNVRRLTPRKEGHYFVPGLESDTTVWGYGPVNWLSKNFSGGGGHILYFHGLSSAFPVQQDSMSGKYRIMDKYEHSHALFPGHDDVNAGYGFLTWGPPGTNEIAYTNTAKNVPASPACVFLVHPDGSGAHSLWCAPSHATPTSVSNLRWSGDGRSLLVYVNWNAEFPISPNWGYYPAAELWRITVATGEAVRVSTMIYEPAQGRSADISYDGNTVVYEQYAPYDSDAPACDPEMPDYGSGSTICARNMTTGKTTVVWEGIGQGDVQLAVAPGGKRMIASSYNNPPGSTGSESDLYLVRTTDGSVIRQLTRRPAAGLPDRSLVQWEPVAWSRDGKRLLVNRIYYAPHVLNQDSQPVYHVYVIDVTDGKARRVVAGRAEDWYQRGW